LIYAHITGTFLINEVIVPDKNQQVILTNCGIWKVNILFVRQDMR